LLVFTVKEEGMSEIKGLVAPQAAATSGLSEDLFSWVMTS